MTFSAPALVLSLKRHAYHRGSLIYYDSVCLALYGWIGAKLSTALQLLTFVGVQANCTSRSALRGQEMCVIAPAAKLGTWEFKSQLRAL